jgi:hypothetical protein
MFVVGEQRLCIVDAEPTRRDVAQDLFTIQWCISGLPEP